MSRSGILSLDRADAVIEISEWVEVPKKNLTVENTTATSPNISVESGAKNVKDESTENLHSNGGIGNVSNSNIEEPSAVELGTEKKLKKRTFRVPLKVRICSTPLRLSLDGGLQSFLILSIVLCIILLPHVYYYLLLFVDR